MPWVVLQVILVAILIFWPQSVTYWIDRGQDRSVDDQDRAAVAGPAGSAADPDRSAALVGIDKRLAQVGIDPMPIAPQAFDALVAKEVAENIALVKAAGIKVQ